MLCEAKDVTLGLRIPDQILRKNLVLFEDFHGVINLFGVVFPPYEVDRAETALAKLFHNLKLI